eukprot:TRINITY_DN1422_c0_g1_i1.p3 TRINITY_DN1422_c0_g1~~TRINITY_DN1422_c0_g1_i1.p3  ORF type:complete len:103 (+),score=0.19 TRINITY_DN1422_c0_g1_i1:986-1294(+)
MYKGKTGFFFTGGHRCVGAGKKKVERERGCGFVSSQVIELRKTTHQHHTHTRTSLLGFGCSPPPLLPGFLASCHFTVLHTNNTHTHTQPMVPLGEDSPTHRV